MYACWSTQLETLPELLRGGKNCLYGENFRTTPIRNKSRSRFGTDERRVNELRELRLIRAPAINSHDKFGRLLAV